MPDCFASRLMSLTSRSNFSSPASRNTSSGVCAVSVCQPCAVNRSRSSRHDAASSSTTRILFILFLRISWEVRPKPFLSSIAIGRYRWETQLEDRAVTGFALDRDAAAVLLHHLADHDQPEPRPFATLFRSVK